MRLRVINQGMNGVLHMKTLLNPFRYPFVSFQLFSHKILRWLAPIFMLTAFVANAFLLGHWFYNVAFALQALFYLMATLGWIADTLGRKSRLLSIPHYFCLVNVASLVSLYKIIRGERVAVWEPIRSP